MLVWTLFYHFSQKPGDPLQETKSPGFGKREYKQPNGLGSCCIMGCLAASNHHHQQGRHWKHCVQQKPWTENIKTAGLDKRSQIYHHRSINMRNIHIAENCSTALSYIQPSAQALRDNIFRRHSWKCQWLALVASDYKHMQVSVQSKQSTWWQRKGGKEGFSQ